MPSTNGEPPIEDDTAKVLEAELAPVSEMASIETAANSSTKRECGFTRYPPQFAFDSLGSPVIGTLFQF